MLRLSYLIVVILCMVPTIPGITGVVLSSLGYIPPLGMHSFSLDGYTQLFSWQGVFTSIRLTVVTSLVSTLLAGIAAFSILQSSWGGGRWRRIELCLSPLLSIPHVAYAIGFAFLFAPTGLGARALLQWFGIDLNDAVDQSLATLVKDPYGLGLIVMLTLKEIPFLLLMSIPVLKQLEVEKVTRVGLSLGYKQRHIWWKALFAQWLTKVRFPLLAVLAYGVSVVDVALIIGPTNPPTFAVLVWQWFNDPDLVLLPRASAGAMLLFVIAGGVIATQRVIEWLVTKGLRYWQYSGRYGLYLPGLSLFGVILTISGLMLPLMMLWSVAHRWRFPDLLPSRYSFSFWQYEWAGIVGTIEQSLILAVISSSVALILAIIAHEYRIKYRLQVPGYLIAVPMLIPQLSLLFGLQVVTLHVQSSAYWLWVCWSHIFFAFPFVYLALDGPWRAYHSGYTRLALSLGKHPITVFFMIKFPQLRSAVLFAWAVGASVSLAQYLPTLVLGAGRVSTLTTEAVALSSGFDRRVTAIYAIWQALLPLIFFAFAIVFSRLSMKKQRPVQKDLLTHESVSNKPHHL
ncbi:ABC transporter permease [Vibrio agarivorans]|uniref:ABC transporter permease n=1 Tax=Vibrio agarivorans TaxID=153622 RepID=UPI00222EC558|nr:thiamine ABC transporter permease [Vibrio agarivorans]